MFSVISVCKCVNEAVNQVYCSITVIIHKFGGLSLISRDNPPPLRDAVRELGLGSSRLGARGAGADQWDGYNLSRYLLQ